MAIPGSLYFYLLSSRSRQLNLIKGECALAMQHAGFAQHHWQQTCCHSSVPDWSETGWTAGQSTLFDQIMAPMTGLSLMCFILMCLWVSPQRFAGLDLWIAGVIPLLSGSTDYSQIWAGCICSVGCTLLYTFEPDTSSPFSWVGGKALSTEAKEKILIECGNRAGGSAVLKWITNSGSVLHFQAGRGYECW